MDITVENLNTIELPAELKTAILSKLENDLPVYLSGKDYYVKPKTEYETEVKTASDKAVQAAIDNEGARLYNSIDTLVGVALGETKPDKMRSRVWFDQLEKDGKLPLSEEAIAKVRAAMKGESSATKDAVVDGLKKQLEQQATDQKNKETEAFGKTVGRVVTADLRNAPVQIDPSLKDETAKSAARTAAISDLKTLFNTLYEGKEDAETGELYFVKKGTDKPLMNVAESRPMSPTEIIRANHSMFLAPAGHQQKGTGTGKQESGTPGAFASVAEIRKYAIEQKGYPAYSDDFNQFVQEEGKKAGLIK